MLELLNVHCSVFTLLSCDSVFIDEHFRSIIAFVITLRERRLCNIPIECHLVKSADCLWCTYVQIKIMFAVFKCIVVCFVLLTSFFLRLSRCCSVVLLSGIMGYKSWRAESFFPTFFQQTAAIFGQISCAKILSLAPKISLTRFTALNCFFLFFGDLLTC